jgi:hypothetical protein
MYISELALRKASHTWATLRPSRSAIASRSFFKLECTRNVSLESFLIGRGFYHSFEIHSSKQELDF